MFKMLHELESLRLEAVDALTEGSVEINSHEVCRKAVCPKLHPVLGTQAQRVLRLLLVKRERASDVARKCGVSRQRVSAIYRRELDRVAKAARLETGSAYDDVVRLARRIYGNKVPVAPVPTVIDFYGVVVVINYFYIALYDAYADVVRIAAASRLVWIPNVGTRVRIRFVQGIGFIDGVNGHLAHEEGESYGFKNH